VSSFFEVKWLWLAKPQLCAISAISVLRVRSMTTERAILLDRMYRWTGTPKVFLKQNANRLALSCNNPSSWVALDRQCLTLEFVELVDTDGWNNPVNGIGRGACPIAVEVL
jgi:hypothetical protein